MRILVTGAGGQLGRALARALDGRHENVLLDRADLDVTDAAAVEAVVRSAAPDAIVHAAAWTDVDGCESDPTRAHLVNRDGARAVANAAGDAFVVVVSTDYVYDGALGRPYIESDPTNPLQVYGASKLAGEEVARAAHDRVAVARTAWLYGPGARNFVTAILGAAARGPFDVVDDQVGSPTAVDDLARALVALCEASLPGVFHTANGGAASRCEFARAIVAGAGMDPGLVRPIATADAPPRPARRPVFAPLEPRAWLDAGFDELPSWEDALSRALPDILAGS